MRSILETGGITHAEVLDARTTCGAETISRRGRFGVSAGGRLYNLQPHSWMWGKGLGDCPGYVMKAVSC